MVTRIEKAPSDFLSSDALALSYLCIADCFDSERFCFSSTAIVSFFTAM